MWGNSGTANTSSILPAPLRPRGRRQRESPPHLIGQARKLSHPSGYDEVNRSSSEILDVDKMDPEMREKRRDAILEQMRRVLDGEQIV
ncbi:hypothetical protein H0H92_008247 [Tricholoma furcatifolium]|nr:hypothetical protein H0H92_008247 [Tricholoma furcatifolium]